MNCSQVGLWYESAIRWYYRTGDTPAYRASVVLPDIRGKYRGSEIVLLAQSRSG
jgi:hypothetical protein